MLRLSIIITCALLLLPTLSWANMTIYPMVVGINEKGEGSVRVISKTNEVQFVKATVFRLEYPASPKEKEVEVATNTANGLTVMPSKFAIPGGSSKLIRLIAMEPVQKEVMYRVKFEGVPAFDSDTSVDEHEIKTQLNVNLIWGVLVSVPPVNPEIKITLSPDKKYLHNSGTQRIKITKLGLCHSDKDEDCMWVNDNRNVFPDGDYQLTSSMMNYRFIKLKYNDWIKKTTNNAMTLAIQ